MVISTRLFCHVFIVIVMLLFGTAHAIDNPDAPDLIGELQAKESTYLEAINKPENTVRDYLIAYDDYETFLDNELNRAYQRVMSRLATPQQEELTKAQRDWIKFRDAEFVFINNNWTRENFGSSFALSRGALRCSIIRDRVMQLLMYAKNYPAQ